MATSLRRAVPGWPSPIAAAAAAAAEAALDAPPPVAAPRSAPLAWAPTHPRGRHHVAVDPAEGHSEAAASAAAVLPRRRSAPRLQRLSKRADSAVELVTRTSGSEPAGEADGEAAPAPATAALTRRRSRGGRRRSRPEHLRRPGAARTATAAGLAVAALLDDDDDAPLSSASTLVGDGGGGGRLSRTASATSKHSVSSLASARSTDWAPSEVSAASSAVGAATAVIPRFWVPPAERASDAAFADGLHQELVQLATWWRAAVGDVVAQDPSLEADAWRQQTSPDADYPDLPADAVGPVLARLGLSPYYWAVVAQALHPGVRFAVTTTASAPAAAVTPSAAPTAYPPTRWSAFRDLWVSVRRAAVGGTLRVPVWWNASPAAPSLLLDRLAFRLLQRARAPTASTASAVSTSSGMIDGSSLYPLVHAVLATHPAFAFLGASPAFQERYADSVVVRMLLGACGRDAATRAGGPAAMTWAGFVHLELAPMLARVAAASTCMGLPMPPVWSYKDFYIIYCRFYDLDRTTQMGLTRFDVARYGMHTLSPAIVDRLFDVHVPTFAATTPHGAAEPAAAVQTEPETEPGSPLPDAPAWPLSPSSAAPHRDWMGFKDFVAFLTAVEDKAAPASLCYWFRCLDLDGDGVISFYEVEQFWAILSLHVGELFGWEALLRLTQDLLGDPIAGDPLWRTAPVRDASAVLRDPLACHEPAAPNGLRGPRAGWALPQFLARPEAAVLFYDLVFDTRRREETARRMSDMQFRLRTTLFVEAAVPWLVADDGVDAAPAAESVDTVQTGWGWRPQRPKSMAVYAELAPSERIWLSHASEWYPNLSEQAVEATLATPWCAGLRGPAMSAAAVEVADLSVGVSGEANARVVKLHGWSRFVEQMYRQLTVPATASTTTPAATTAAAAAAAAAAASTGATCTATATTPSVATAAEAPTGTKAEKLATGRSSRKSAAGKSASSKWGFGSKSSRADAEGIGDAAAAASATTAIAAEPAASAVRRAGGPRPSAASPRGAAMSSAMALPSALAAPPPSSHSSTSASASQRTRSRSAEHPLRQAIRAAAAEAALAGVVPRAAADGAARGIPATSVEAPRGAPAGAGAGNKLVAIMTGSSPAAAAAAAAIEPSSQEEPPPPRAVRLWTRALKLRGSSLSAVSTASAAFGTTASGPSTPTQRKDATSLPRRPQAQSAPVSPSRGAATTASGALRAAGAGKSASSRMPRAASMILRNAVGRAGAGSASGAVGTGLAVMAASTPSQWPERSTSVVTAVDTALPGCTVAKHARLLAASTTTSTVAAASTATVSTASTARPASPPDALPPAAAPSLYERVLEGFSLARMEPYRR
ncbi:hypothetical protein CXG81DRAFT_18407 [Caulochytrium protostelioides]|uniref:EF-hand domain-containing protein n=1 Tax=Caulochytrium protostelioides TaxID=1555241 RepID=A0A4P9X984_9FUNG|nr:hypothetical protein CXG81DRAFT_18407 [Caulochytrium protostelioides]|eukprot:RKP01842.1 hypothetical protein CXG81DRAFT_18407 [Caulochytrium protostelioides]